MLGLLQECHVYFSPFLLPPRSFLPVRLLLLQPRLPLPLLLLPFSSLLKLLLSLPLLRPLELAAGSLCLELLLFFLHGLSSALRSRLVNSHLVIHLFLPSQDFLVLLLLHACLFLAKHSCLSRLLCLLLIHVPLPLRHLQACLPLLHSRPGQLLLPLFETRFCDALRRCRRSPRRVLLGQNLSLRLFEVRKKGVNMAVVRSGRCQRGGMAGRRSAAMDTAALACDPGEPLSFAPLLVNLARRNKPLDDRSLGR